MRQYRIKLKQLKKRQNDFLEFCDKYEKEFFIYKTKKQAIKRKWKQCKQQLQH